MWHIDGYNKLKPFGFAIHGAIDGYRKILWLNIGSSNNNARVISSYHLSSCISDITTQTNLLVEIVLDMVHQLPVKGSKHGVHSQGTTEPVGGSTSLKTWQY